MKKTLASFILFLFFMSSISGGSLRLSTLQSNSPETYVSTSVESMENVRQLRQYSAEAFSKKWLSGSNDRYFPVLKRSLFTFIQYALALSSATVIHEVGHAEAVENFGGMSQLGVGDNVGLSIWEMYVETLISSERAYTSYTGSFTNEERALISGAGMNANLDYTRWIRRESLLNDSVEFVDVIDSFVNRFIVWGYFLTNLNGGDLEGDPNVYVGDLERQGVDTSVETIFMLHTIAMILSGDTYQSHDTLKPKPFHTSKKGTSYFLPDHYVYHNSNNVSYAIEGVIRKNIHTSYLYGLEHTVIGESQPLEFLIGVDHRSRLFRQLVMGIYGGKHYYLSGEVTLLKYKRVLPFIQFVQGDSGTLFQKRSWPHSDGNVFIGVKVPIK